MTHALSIRKPIVGAINGGCAGFGLVQALHFDIRFAAESAVLSTAFVRRGLNAEYGASWLLPRMMFVNMNYKLNIEQHSPNVKRTTA